MTIEAVFTACNYGVLPAWLLLVIGPRWRATRWLVHSVVPCLLLTPVYATLLFGDDPGPQGASFFSLSGVTRIFTTPWTITACWIHYLVMDLFVGAWEVRDAERLGIRHWFVVPSLILTLVFGPIGLLSWAVIRAALRRTLSANESSGVAVEAQ